jgi:tetratricopeptide (TPR) repeat protein
MNLQITRYLLAVGAAGFLSVRLLAADAGDAATDTNSAAITRDEVAENFLQIQAQLRATQAAIEQHQQVALETGQSNAVALAQGLESLEQSLSNQRIGEAEDAHKTQQFTLLIAAAFGLIGLGVLLLMVYYQWRAFAQLAQISTRQHFALAHGGGGLHNGDAGPPLAAPGRATVETSSTQLLSAVDRLEQRIHELESEHRLLPEITGGKPLDMLVEGQKYLDANLPLQALECFDKILAAEPGRTDAMVRRAAALEKLGRDDDALASYNRAIAADNSLVIAHLHKGGLLNRLRRYDEALNCYEQALLGQDRKVKA